MTPNRFLAIKLFTFLLISYFCFSFIYSFPDVPSILKPILKKGAINLVHENRSKPDARFLKWFDRDPERTIPTSPGLVVSPADGIVQGVVAIEESQHIVIEMRYTDVHVQRVPLDGEVISIVGDGEKLPSGTNPYQYAQKKMMPYQKRTVFKTEIGEVAVRQITSFFASRARVFLTLGENVKRGQRLGNILAGSTVVLEIPKEIEVYAQKNQEVIAGETILAKYRTVGKK